MPSFFNKKEQETRTDKDPAEIFYSMAHKNPPAFNMIIDHAKTEEAIRTDVANYLSGIVHHQPVFLKIAKDAPKQFEKLAELAKFDDSILYSFIAAAKMDDPKIAELSKYILEKLSQDPAIKAKIDSYQEPEMPVGFNI